MTQVIMDITGMHCGGCATGIQMVTEQMDGVTSSFVDLDSNKGTFEVSTDEVVPKIIEEIQKLGYGATVAQA